MPRPNGMRYKKTSIRTIALALIAVSLLVCLVAFAQDGAAPAPREPKVDVHFLSKPDNADLYVDGKFVGSTDVLLRLAPGVHSVEIKLDDYEPWRRELTVQPQSPTRVAARLKSQR